MPTRLHPVASQQFRDAMARVASAVHVVTTDGPAGRHGVTVSALAPVTDAPPTLLICLNRLSRANPALKTNAVLAVNTLAAGQEAVARLFATRGEGDGADRFTEGDWMALSTGAPVFRHVVSAFDCRVRDVVEKGTHTVFFAEVVATLTPAQDGALAYVNRAYHGLRLDP